MNEPKLVESQLHCKASASIIDSILEDLTKEDRPLDSILLDKDKDDATTKQLPSEVRN